MYGMITIAVAVTLVSQATWAAQAAVPSQEWEPRYAEFTALVEKRPLSEEVKGRLVALLRSENSLMLARLDTGDAAVLGEGYYSYIDEIVEEVFKLVKDGYTPGLQALIETPRYDPQSVIGRFIATAKWREALPYFLGLDRTRGQGVHYAFRVEMFGMIYRRQAAEMSASERQQVENRLLDALTDPHLVVRMCGFDAVVDAGLKSAIPLLQERAKKSERDPGTGRYFEREAALAAIQKLERMH
jgi:hypothetical protein